MVQQDSLISAFPIVLQDGPSPNRRVRSTFIRAHVMERYHRERRAKKESKENGVGTLPEHTFVVTTKQLQWQEVKNIGNVLNKKNPSEAHTSAAEARRGKNSVDLDNTTRCTGSTPEMHIQKLPLERQKLSCLSLKDPIMDNSSRFLEIINDYSKVLESGSTPFDVMHKVWLPAAFSDPVLFHASFSNYSTHVSALCEQYDVPVSLEHKGIALQQISRRITDSEYAITDKMIASVLCLIGLELLNQDPAALNAHIKGIRQMIAARGGAEVLGFNGVLKRLYLTYELLFSTVFKNRPVPPIDSSPQLLSSIYLPNSSQYGIFTLSKIHVDPTCHGFSKNTVRLLSSLCHYLCIADASIHSHEQTPRMGGPIKPLMKLLTEFTHLPSDPTQIHSSDDHVLQALIIATTIQFPDLNPSSAQVCPSRRTKELQRHLCQTSIRSFWQPIPGALLWCYVVGAIASEGVTQRTWFMANLIRITTGLAFENWEGVRNTLETFAKIVASEE